MRSWRKISRQTIGSGLETVLWWKLQGLRLIRWPGKACVWKEPLLMWTVIIYNQKAFSLLFFFFWLCHQAWDRSSWPGIEPVPPAGDTLEAWRVGHWTSMEVPWSDIIQNAETCGRANKCLPDTGFSQAGALWKWEPHLYSLLPSEHAAGPIHFPVLWTLLTQAQQNQALFFCKGSIWFQVIKEKPRTCCWAFDKHLGGCTGALFPRVPLWLQRHILQRSLFGVLAYQDNLGSAPGGNWFTQNSSTSAQILESNRRLKWGDHYPLTHTDGTQVSWTHREWVEGRHEA